MTRGIKEFLVAKNSRFGYLAESNGTIDIVDMNTGSNYSSSAIETGKNLMGVSLQNGVLVLRAYASPDLTLMKYHEGAGLEEVENFDGRDGTLLAVSCVDGVLRVLNTGTYCTVAEIPFAGANRRFIRFSEDSTELMLQGDDYYFRVYNLEQQQFTHIESEQYYEISKAIVDEGTGTISLVTSAEMIILDGKSYEKLAGAEKGVVYLPASGAVFCKYS